MAASKRGREDREKWEREEALKKKRDEMEGGREALGRRKRRGKRKRSWEGRWI